MLSLLQTELKMKRNHKAFWIYIAISIIYSVLLNNIIASYNLEQLQQNMTSLFYCIDVSIIVAIMFTYDFNNRCINNLITSGKQKWQIYFSKVFFILIVLFGLQIVNLFISFLHYLILQGNIKEYFQYFDMVLIYSLFDYLYQILIIGICILIGSTTCNSLATVGLSCVFFAIICMLETRPWFLKIFKNIICFFPNHLYISIFYEANLIKNSIVNLISVSLFVFIITVFFGYLIFKNKDFN